MLWSDNDVGVELVCSTRFGLLVRNRSNMFLPRVGCVIYWHRRFSSIKAEKSSSASVGFPVVVRLLWSHWRLGKLKSPVMISELRSSVVLSMCSCRKRNRFLKLGRSDRELACDGGGL